MSRSRKYNQTTKLISTWEELSKCTSETYDIEIDIKGCNGWVTKKNSAFDYSHDYYLSTHTFYGLNYRNSTKELQKRGFNVEIANWDKERGEII